jgi:hypothetical protein
VIITLNDIEYTFEMDDPITPEIETATIYTHAFSLPEGWIKCDPMIYEVRLEGDGQPVWLGTDETPEAVTYYLYEPCTCDEAFSYIKENNNLSVTFTYVSEVDLTDAEVKITCPHITGFVPLDGKSYTVNNAGNVTVLTWISDITACEEITFEFNFTPDCEQNAAGFAILWTDFKVNGASKKQLTPPKGMEWSNILYDCTVPE